MAARGLILATLCSLTGGMLLASASAFAAAPTIEDQYVTEVTPLSATLNAEIDPGGVDTSYSFEYGTTSFYGTKIPLPATTLGPVTYGTAEFPRESRRLEVKAISGGAFSVGQLIGGQGIASGTEITAVREEAGGSQELTLSILTVENSNGVAVFAVSPASQRLQGLQPNTTYHYRVVASNEVGGKIETSEGSDATFTTAVPSSALPDGRIEEMVTPVENHDADIYSPGLGVQQNGLFDLGENLPFQVSRNGDAVTYVGDPTPEGTGAAGEGETANQYLATRTSSGWVQQNITPRARPKAVYEEFSPDLTSAVLRAGGNYLEPTALLPEAPNGYKILYERNNLSGDTHALFTSFFGGQPEGLADSFAGGTEGFKTVLLEASAPLTEDAPVGDDLYKETAGKLSLVNLLPDGAAEPEAVFGAPDATGSEGQPDYSHDISGDGTRVFWTGLRSHALYMDESGSPSLQLDASQAGGPGGGGQFWTASADGSKIFFTDWERLTANSTATAEVPATPEVPANGSEPAIPAKPTIPAKADLYEYDSGKPVGQRLTDLTVDAGGPADVQGVVGTSADGSYVYFVANGVLGDGAERGAPIGECEHEYTLEGDSFKKCNLYVHHGGVTHYIARLSDRDGVRVEPASSGGEAGEHGDWVQAQGAKTAEVTASGEVLTFVSTQKLTSYDNRQLLEVYVYEANSQHILCASCDPTGVAPPSFGAAILPPRTSPAASEPQDRTYAPQWMSADGGKVFFDSSIPLVPEDTNGLIDVYEWEREGADESCPVTVPARQDGGCVFLLSGGKSDDDSYLIGASETGSDAFFVTRAQLAEADHNENFDVYDAREDGTRPVNPPACSGTGCQGVPSAPPIFSTPASETFNGVGNLLGGSVPATKPKRRALTNSQKLAAALKACKRKPKKQRTQCEKQARKRHAVKSKAKHSARKGH